MFAVPVANVKSTETDTRYEHVSTDDEDVDMDKIFAVQESYNHEKGTGDDDFDKRNKVRHEKIKALLYYKTWNL